VRGWVGELRWDGGRAGGAAAAVAGGLPSPRSVSFGDGALAVLAWGARHPAVTLGWCFEASADLVLIADATLYDGERLRTSLGLDPGTDSPPSLLLQAWQRWGEGMLDRLDGDYAIVVCDLRRRRVVMMTDPVGMRSLFFQFAPGRGIAFATTPEVLAQWLGLDARLPERRLLEPLFGAEQLGYLEPEIPGVDRLLAGQIGVAGDAGIRRQCWWRPGGRSPGLAAGDVNGWIDGLRWHLEEAVRKRLADGLRTGVQFSGGLDSAAVLALAAQRTGGHLETYSLIDHTQVACPETQAIESTLAALNLPGQCVDLADLRQFPQRAREIAAHLPRFVDGRNGFLPLFEHMAAEAGVCVLMNGLDGDTVFHYEDLLERQAKDAWAEARHNAALQDAMAAEPWMMAEVRRLRLSSRLPWWLRERIRDVRSRLSERARFRAAFLSDTAVTRLDLRARMRAYLASLRKPRPPQAGVPTESVVRLVNQEATARFQRRMRHAGLEMRCPLLDRALIEFSAWIPLDLRLRDGHLKWIFRRAVEPLLPREVVWRGDKSHLGSYFDRVMLQPVLDQLVRDFQGSGPIVARWVDRVRVLEVAQRWQDGHIDAVWQLRVLLLLEHWLRHHASKVAWEH